MMLPIVTSSVGAGYYVKEHNETHNVSACWGFSAPHAVWLCIACDPRSRAPFIPEAE